MTSASCIILFPLLLAKLANTLFDQNFWKIRVGKSRWHQILSPFDMNQTEMFLSQTKCKKTFPQKKVGAAAQQLPLWNARWYRRGSSTDEALHIFFFSVSRLFSLSNKWLHSELKRDPFKQRARLCSLFYRPSGILLKTIYIWCMCVCICFAYATKSQKIKRRHLIVKNKKSNILRPNLFRDPHFCYFFFFSKISPATLYFKRPIFIQFFQ